MMPICMLAHYQLVINICSAGCSPVAVPQPPELFHEEALDGRPHFASGDRLLHEAAHPHVDVARVAVGAREAVEDLVVLQG